jgi:hypothetical protein
MGKMKELFYGDKEQSNLSEAYRPPLINYKSENPTPIEVGDFSGACKAVLQTAIINCHRLKLKTLKFVKKLEVAATEAKRIDRNVRAAREKKYAQLSLFPRGM